MNSNHVVKLSNSDIFFYMVSPQSIQSVNIIPDDIDIKEYIYINGKRITDYNENEQLLEAFNDETTSTHVYHFHISSDCQNTPSEIVLNNQSVTIDDNELINNLNYKHYNSMIDGKASFMLLRTNPKLTGNIKVVVDSNSNLYLDTFKINKTLSQKKYSKIELSTDEYYGTTIMRKFKEISSNDLYKIEDRCYDIFSQSNTPNDQYYDTYNYGVRTNNNNTYSENFSLLAPLCIKEHMPDFFVIFKIENPSQWTTPNDKIKNFIKNGNIIKVFDMREDTNIGKYIRKIYEKSKDFCGDLFVSYDYDSFNVYNGISIERGEVSNIYESASLERQLKNQVAMNNWYTLGFERNKILSKDIINFEFMFDDKDASMFSINTYFGLYIKLNGEEENFTCIGEYTDENSDDSSVLIEFDTSISGELFEPLSDDYENIPFIYGYSTLDTFVKVNKNIHKCEELSEYINKPHKNVLSSYLSSFESDIYPNKFVSVIFDLPPEPCEHFRVILKNIDKTIIYEVLFSNSINEELEMSEICTYTNNNVTTHRISIYNTLFRTALETHTDDEIKEIKYKYITLLTKAFNKFDEHIKAFYDNKNIFSIITDNVTDDRSFEKIYSLIIDSEYIDNYDDNSIEIFGIKDIPSFIVEVTDEIFFPINFEVLGKRIAKCVKFKSTEDIKIINKNINEDLNQYTTIIYQSNDEDNLTGYNQLNYMSIDVYETTYDTSNNTTNIEDTTIITKNRCISGFGEYESYAISLHDPTIYNNKINFYTNYPINCGLCSILPIKDFDINVMDTTRIEDTQISNSGGQYTQQNNPKTENSLTSYDEECIQNYIDVDETIINENDNINDSSVIIKLIENNKNKSDISLLNQYCVKWNMVGTDYVGDKMRIMFDYSNKNVNNYYITQNDDDFVGYCTLDIDSDDNTSYQTMNKFINNYIDNEEYPKFRENLLNGNITIKDTIYHSNNTNDKMSEIYVYDANTIEFLSGGVKMRLSSLNTSILNVNDFVGYLAIIISCTGNNPTSLYPFELFIDKTSKTIAFIIYNGNDKSQMKILADASQYHVNEVRKIRRTSKFESYMLDEGTDVQVPNDGNYDSSTELCNNKAFMSILSYPKDSHSYTNDSFVKFTSTIGQYIDSSKNKIIAHDTSLYVDGIGMPVNEYNFQRYATKEYPTMNGFIMLIDTQDGFNTDYNTQYTYTFEEIKNYIESNSKITITIKNNPGDILDYTEISNEILKIFIVESFDISRENSEFESIENYGEVFSSHAEPKTYNIVDFVYKNDTLNNVFNKNFNGCNIIPNSIKNIEQMWLKKYTNLSTPYKSSYTPLCLYLHKNFPTIQNCWESEIFRNYSNGIDASTYTRKTYKDNGYEKNTFFGSKAISLKSNDTNTITISSWKNVTIDAPNKSITMNITESVIDYIYNNTNFTLSWEKYHNTNTRRSSNDMAEKTNYIKNTIMPFIKINSESIISVKRYKSDSFGIGNQESVRSTQTSNMRTNSILNSPSIKKIEQVNNISKKVYINNNKYYITLTNLDDKYQYIIEMTLNL